MSETRKPVTIVVCPCGKRLHAAGAVPGRVGRCPACGARFQVPGVTTASVAPVAPPPAPAVTSDEVYPTRAPVGPTAFVAAMGGSSGASSEAHFRQRDGLIHPPRQLETRLRESVLYPLWGATGLSLLVVMPPFFWLTSLPIISVVAVLLAEGPSASTRFGVMFLTAIVPFFALVLSYTLLYLGRVLVASALGEIHHPRWPSWDLDEMFRGVCRWFWAVLVGAGIGVIPAMAYWISCGDLDALDIVVLVDLLALGAAYAQMALLATILHDDPLGANPITVVQGIVRIGWSYGRACVVSGVILGLVITASIGLFYISHPLLGAVALWAFWVMALYLAMVALRVLGLCYHHRSRALGWFKERPRSGV